MPKNGYKKKGRREPPWSDLPTEIIELILKHCNFSDQARLRAVCRRWQSIGRVQPLKQLPWLMAYDRKWSRCKLFDPMYKKTYTVNMSTIKEYYQEQNFFNICICASKSGWLLLTYPTHQILRTAFFLYSPFVNRIIKLPILQTAHYWKTATFSADPTSADCVFFVLEASSYANIVVANTFRRGDTKWTTHVFPGSFDAIYNVVYSEGLFWCASDDGRLATFSVAERIWNVHVLSLPAPRLPSNCVGDGTYLVESDGNLLLVLFSHIYKTRQVFKLDRSQMPWIWIEDVGDQTLFLGPTSLSVSTAVEGKSRKGSDYNLFHGGWKIGSGIREIMHQKNVFVNGVFNKGVYSKPAGFFNNNDNNFNVKINKNYNNSSGKSEDGCDSDGGMKNKNNSINTITAKTIAKAVLIRDSICFLHRKPCPRRKLLVGTSSSATMIPCFICNNDTMQDYEENL